MSCKGEGSTHFACDCQLKRMERQDEMIKGYQMEMIDIHDTLAKALHYSYDPDYGFATGDHTQTSLADEAARRIGELEEEIRCGTEF